MGSDEKELEELLKIKRRRLTALRKQIAQFGYNAPAELRTERDELETELGITSKVIDPIVRGDLPDDVMAAIRSYGATASINNALQLVEAALYELRKALGEHKVELHEVKDKVITLNVDVRELKRDNEEGKSGRARNFRLQVTNIILLLFVVSMVVALALQVFGP